MSVALAVMARYPFGAEVKTRLAPRLDAGARARLYRAFLDDTLRQVASVADVSPALVYTPPGERSWFSTAAGSSVELHAQRGASLGERVIGAFEDLFARHACVVLLGSDAPNLPAAHLERAARALEQGAELVLGPAEDGGYYCIGLRQPRPELFRRIEWSTPRTRAQTLAAASELGLQAELLPPWYDIDEPPDLDRLARDLARDPAAAPASWAALQKRPR